MAAPRPLPPPPVESIAVEGRKRNRRCTENKKAGEITTSTSVSSCKDGLLPLQQVSYCALTVYTVYRHITVHLCQFLNILLAKTVCVCEMAKIILKIISSQTFVNSYSKLNGYFLSYWLMLLVDLINYYNFFLGSSFVCQREEETEAVPRECQSTFRYVFYLA